MNKHIGILVQLYRYRDYCIGYITDVDDETIAIKWVYNDLYGFDHRYSKHFNTILITSIFHE